MLRMVDRPGSIEQRHERQAVDARGIRCSVEHRKHKSKDAEIVMPSRWMQVIRGDRIPHSLLTAEPSPHWLPDMAPVQPATRAPITSCIESLDEVTPLMEYMA